MNDTRHQILIILITLFFVIGCSNENCTNDLNSNCGSDCIPFEKTTNSCFSLDGATSEEPYIVITDSINFNERVVGNCNGQVFDSLNFNSEFIVISEASFGCEDCYDIDVLNDTVDSVYIIKLSINDLKCSNKALISEKFALKLPKLYRSITVNFQTSIN